MAHSVIILRTHYISSETFQMASALAHKGAEVVIAIDETHATISSPIPKISVTPRAAVDLGLSPSPDFAWRCGDYCLYMARQQYPDASEYWLVEHDVRINWQAAASFFLPFRDSTAHFHAARLQASDQNWYWHRSLGDREGVMRCLFPIVRATGEAIDYLLPLRRLSTPSHHIGLPNDEAFVATTLSDGGFYCADIAGVHPGSYDWSTFSFSRPIPVRSFDRNKPDARLYHPVLSGPAFLKKAMQYCSKPRRPAELEEIAASVELECGPEVAANFRHKVHCQTPYTTSRR
ncbi:hypothetical protein ACO2I3_15605 [Leptospira interrogans]